MRPEDPPPVRLVDYAPPSHLVETVSLDIALDPTATRVVATLALRPNPDAPDTQTLTLDCDALIPARMSLDGRHLAPEAYRPTNGVIRLTDVPQRPFTLETTTVLDPKANTALTGLYLSNGVFCTQCEAEGFRRITPFLDRPDVLARYTTRITAPKALAPVLLSNGNPVAAGDLDGGRHFAEWHDPWPKPAYLFALVGGDLAVVRDQFVTRSGRNVRLEIYVEHGKAAACAWAMESLKRCMRWDEEVFGREYDLDVFMIVAVSDFNMGAMENKGLNVFNDKYVLALPETATDADFVHIEAIIAHEYFHNWTGNRITCRDWFQLCLKEGLTVYRDQEFTSDVRSRAVKRIADVRNLRTQQFAEDAGPLAHPVRPQTYREINNFYTATVYEKGAEVVRMLRTLIGDAAFAAGMALYFDRHDGDAATVEQFIACFAETSGRDLKNFMRWYEQAGTPELVVEGRYDPSARTYTLDVTQSVPPTPGQPTKEPMIVPLRVGLVGQDGRDLPLSVAGRPLENDVVVVEASHASFRFDDISAPPVPSLLRGFSVPVRLRTRLTDTDLLFLLANDSDPFNRWQAGQTLAMREMVARVRPTNGVTPGPKKLAEALGRVLADTSLDPAFVAQVLALPSETDIARELERDVDPDAVFSARKGLRADIAAILRAALHACVTERRPLPPYRPDAVSVGGRALANGALDLLASIGEAEVGETAERQFATADNMTDRIAALSTLSQWPGDRRERAFDAFYRRHASDALVIDKWFAAQAVLAEESVLRRIRALMSHPSFSFTNPNRVRALVGTFAMANATQFNRADGAGFAFVADIVIELDRRNPQVAARLLSAFRSWRALEPVRRARAQTELSRVAGTAGLSRDVSDIAQRALG